jgi:predicted methyltransferase
LILKVTKSIDFTMLIVRIGLSIDPKLIATTLKIMIMKKIEKISLIEIKERIINFIKSMVLGVAFVEKDGLTSDYKA